MKTIWFFTAVLTCILLLAGRAHAAPQTLVNDFETASDTSQCSVQNCTQTFISSGSGITHGAQALQVTWTSGNHAYPGDTILLPAAQDWSASGGLAMDVYNPGSQPVAFTVRIDDGTNQLYGVATIATGTETHMVLPFTLTVPSIASSLGMGVGIPSAPYGYTVFPLMFGTATLPNLSSILRIILYQPSSPSTNQTLVFDNLHLIPGQINASLAISSTAVNNFESSAEQALVTGGSGVTYSIVTSPALAITTGSKALCVNWTANSGIQSPALSLIPSNEVGTPASADWLGQNGIGFAMDIYNPNSSAVPFNVIISSQTGSQMATGTIAATSTGSFIVPLSTTSPLGIANYTDLAVSGSALLDTQHITGIRLAMNAAPPATTTLYFDSLRLLTGNVLVKTVDQYGQNARVNFSGKIYADSDLTAATNAEAADLAANPTLPGRDKYGGWAGSTAPLLTSGSFFRTQQIDGQWWLVDPAGRLFFSTGLTTMSYDTYTEATFITGTSSGAVDRSNMFSGLPPYPGSSGTTAYTQFWSTDAGNPPFSGGGKVYNFYQANLYRKYGSNWQTSWTTNALNRLQSWGFNTVADFANSSVAPNAKVPYTVGYLTTYNVYFKTYSTVLGTMPDPWDPGFATTCANNFADAANHKNDPWAVGYFVDNEPAWGTTTWGATYYPAVYPVVYTMMASSTSNSPAKAQLISQLQQEYSTISALNSAWGTSLSSWTTLSNPYTLSSSSLSAQAQADFNTFMYSYASQYFSVVATQLKAYDPNHLYLGCKFEQDYITTPVLNAAAKYCDVVSTDAYDITVDNTWNYMDAIGKPCIVGEFAFSASDTGQFPPENTTLFTGNQTARGAAFEAYVQSVMAHPSFVGCHWFQYIEEELGGRPADGENASVGFVQNTDVPHPEMVAAARAVNATLYTRFVSDIPVLAATTVTTAGTTKNISWAPVSNATGYLVECSTSSTFSTILAGSGWITGTSYTFNGLPDGPIYYQVESRQGSGATEVDSAWSVPVSSVQDSMAINLTSPAGLTTSSYSQMIQGTATASSGVQSLTLNGVGVSTSNGYATWTGTLNGVRVGANTISLVATNGASPPFAHTQTATITGIAPTCTSGNGLPDSWVAQYSITSGPLGDDNHDGVPNLMEYALGTNPLATNNPHYPSLSVQTNPADGKKYLTVQYPWVMNDIAIGSLLETSTDLVNWSSSPSTLQQVAPPVPNSDGVTQTFTIRVLPDISQGPRQFIRLGAFTR